MQSTLNALSCIGDAGKLSDTAMPVDANGKGRVRITPVPQGQPRANYLAYKDEIDTAVARVLASGRYILGDETSAFESEFAGFVGARHGIGVASGTDALILGLRALGVGPGDGVVTVSHTSVATVAAIELAGARPILVDVEAGDYTMAPSDLAGVLDRPEHPVKAIIPVHLYGCPARMQEICALAEAYGVPVLEDASQAHGAAIGDRKAGNFGRLGAFSLYPTKNLGAIGDAGILVTSDAKLAARIRSLRQYGWNEQRISEIAGMNSRLDELQAAILRVKLRHLDSDNARRRAIARAYDLGFEHLPVVLPARRGETEHVFHQYVIRIADRDRVRIRLQERGIETALHYPLPVHLQPGYRERLATGPSKLAVTESLASEILSLPMFPQLEESSVRRIVHAVRDVLSTLPAPG